MPRNILVSDASVRGDVLRHVQLEVPGELLSVRELIRMRIYHDAGEKRKQPSPLLKGARPPGHRQEAQAQVAPLTFDAECQVGLAIEAFQHKELFVLVNDRQMESLDEEIFLSDETTISFLNLSASQGA